jgi:hypothetical protein
VLELGTIPLRLEATNVGCGRGPHDREQAIDRLQHALHASECQRRGAIGDDLEIVRPRISPNPPDRIGDDVLEIE